ncbi:beta-ketoacyl synthase chain length factor [Mucilaginibacter sp. UC70_90]
MSPFFQNWQNIPASRLTCIEPDYKTLIDPKLLRRMSRIIKMGVAAGTACLHGAGIDIPDAIITGTAYGCLEDTNTFLSKMVQQNEEALAPTAFIQSTHNTISAQIALLLQCHNYNNTFVNGGASFENALLDAMMLLYEGEACNVLVGGIDEITVNGHVILHRMGLYRRGLTSNLELLQSWAKEQWLVKALHCSCYVISHQAATGLKLMGFPAFINRATLLKSSNRSVISYPPKMFALMILACS